MQQFINNVNPFSRKLVVANPEMLRDATNLFRPKYTTKIDRDIGNAISKFDGWYDKVKQKLREDRLDDLFAEIEVSSLPAISTDFG